MNPFQTLPRSFFRSLVLLSSVSAVLLWLAGGAFANPGRLDPSFVPTPPPNGAVRAILPLADGSVIVGGEFTGSGSAPQAYLAKYRSDGSLDTTFAPVLDGAVQVITAASSGGFYIGGSFTTVDGAASGGLALMTGSGELNLLFLTVGTGFNGTVHAIKEGYYSPLVSLVVGGSFSTYRGQTAMNLAGLSYLGNLGLNYGVNGPVRTITDFDRQAGTLVFGGSFTMTGNLRVNNLGFGNASGAITNSVIPSPNAEITDILAIQDIRSNQFTTSVFVFSGSFTSMGGSAPGIAAFRKSNNSFPRINFGTAGVSQATALCSDLEKRLVAGSATGNLWRFDPLVFSDSFTSPWNANAGFLPSSHTDGKIDAIVQESQFRYYIGGEFTTTDSQPVPYFARLLGPLGSTTPVPPKINISTASDDRILLELEPVPYATGYRSETSADGGKTWTTGTVTNAAFITVKGLRAEEDYLVRVRSLNTNGTGVPGTTTAFRTSVRRNSGTPVYTRLPGDWAKGAFNVSGLLVDASGRLGIIGPNDMKGNLLGGFAVLDAHLDPVFSYNSTNNPRVDYAAADPRGGYVVKSSLRPIERLDSGGLVDGSFMPAYDPTYHLRDLSVQSDGGVVISGTMRTSEGAPNGALVRLEANGAIGTGFDPQFLDGSSSPQIDRIRPAHGDGLLVIGEFVSVDGVEMKDMALLTSGGEVDPLFRPDFEQTRNWLFDDAAMDSQGRILAAGLFANKGGGGRIGVIRFLPDGSFDPDWDPPVFYGSIGNVISPDHIMVQPDDKVLVAGGFRIVNGLRACSVVRLNVDGTIDGTFDAGLGFRNTSGGMANITAIMVMPDSTVAVGGWFNTTDGDHREGFALLRGDGTTGDFPLWLLANGLPAGSGPSNDTDGDGLSDGIEFAYSRDPKKSDTHTVLTMDGKIPGITPPTQRGLEVSGLFSETLGTWEVIPIEPDWTLEPPVGKGSSNGYFRIGLAPANPQPK